jgi:hypothetical protein
MPRHEYAKPLITKDGEVKRVASSSRVSSTTTEIAEMTVKQEQKGILAFERVSFVQSQSNFEELRVSSVESRLKRGSSITTCLMDVLRAPSMIHSTPSMEMLEDFQKLEVQTGATLDPGFFNPRSALFLFQDIEMHD